MNMGIFPFWLLIGGCAAALNVPHDLVAVGVAEGLALSLLVATRQSNFLTPMLVAAIPLFWRYVITPALSAGTHAYDASTRIAELASSPTFFIVVSIMSGVASWALAMKWKHTGKA